MAGGGHPHREACPLGLEPVGLRRKHPWNPVACWSLEAPSRQRVGSRQGDLSLRRASSLLHTEGIKSCHCPSTTPRSSFSVPSGHSPGSGIVSCLDHCNHLGMGFLPPAPTPTPYILHLQSGKLWGPELDTWLPGSALYLLTAPRKRDSYSFSI